MGVLFDVGPSETRSGSPDGHLRSITGLSLAGSDPDGQRVVNVWVDDGHGEYVIGTLSSEARILAVRPPVLVNDEALVRHDGVAATVRFYGGVHDPPPPPPPSVAGAEESRVAITDDGEVEATVPEEDGGGEDEVDDEALWVEFDPPNEEDEAERYDSDNNDEEDEGDGVEEGEPSKDGAGECSKKASLPLVAAPPGTVVPDGQFLGPARFAAVENTAGFMRLAASEVAMDQDRRNEILVLYRYTRFSRTWSGRRGVETCRRTKLHRLRFAVPPAGDMASSLAWAGASLGPLIYPALFCRQLQELWMILAAAPPINNIPPQATQIQVIVDVGILRREDNSPERMEYMRGALEAKMQEAWPVYYHVGMELHLPEPVRHEEEEQGGGDDTRPLKRRKIVDDEEECSVCLDPLERGLAAWPGCLHVFHGACVEKTLARSDMCPLCRNKLCRLVLERRCYPLETD